ncbi:actin filament-associated protein 1-like 1 [Gadus morhua]|uniref:Actin filament-associated protein 1-like 1 n=1 Tax=Gadus morhua TaxID=8049 RepID=A0A8C4ZDK5_GADMO|nr:actin filament-associated protein 1-like 1 [Gadus morhua]
MESKRQNVAVERLVSELGLLLKMLDTEKVSPATADKMVSVRSILETVQPTGNGSDLYMNSCLYGNGTSFVESLFDDFDCDLHMLSASPVEQKEEEKTILIKSIPTSTPPPRLTTPPPRLTTPPPRPVTPPPRLTTLPPRPATPVADDYYEEAVPPEQYLGPGTHSSGYCVEDAYYEDADDNYPSTRLNGPPKNSYNDSDAVSSSYESYEEEDEEAKGRDQAGTWAAEDPSNGSVRDCRICAFLLRKKRFGQWTKQLAVVRDNKLQCYKSIKDSTPNTELPLNLCNVIYVPKEGRKKRHELRFSLPGGEALVLAVQSKEQAQRWLKVVQDASSVNSNTESHEGAPSPIIQRKMELDKMRVTDKGASDSDSGPPGDPLAPGRDGDTLGRGKRGPLSELTGSMKKINRIISFSKRKPPLPGDPPSSSDNQDNTCTGYLSVCLGGAWKERWCVLRGGTLYLQRDPGDTRPPVIAVPLVGAEVVPGGLGPKHPFSFRVLQAGKELLALEASCWEDLGRWLGVLLAKTGCSTLPEELHYDYIDVETLSDIQHAARNSFQWAKTGTISSSSNSVDSRMYDEVYESILDGAVEAKPGQVRRHASFSSRGSDRTEQQAAVKRHASNVNQYGRYGKTRAEEDARRYLRQKEELEEEKEQLKHTLLSVRQERREVKEQLRSGANLRGEQRLAQLEVVCKEREEERVELELRLTEVKENLKKSLAGGALGPPTDSRNSIKAQGRKVEKVYTESVPVNSASELRKRPPSCYATSGRGTVMQKAKAWESKQVV